MVAHVAGLVAAGAVLADVVPRGVGFHHAGLCPEDRGAVEALFREGGLPVLVSTSTLAMGVNLPAHLVVVKSTSTYALGGTGLYPDLVVDQMLGRAGRPQVCKRRALLKRHVIENRTSSFWLLPKKICS